MAALLRLLVVGGIAFAGVVYILFHLFNFKFNLFGNNRRLKRDIDALRKQVDSNALELVEIDQEEASLLSGDFAQTLNSNRITAMHHGVVYSIYNEPLVKFAFKSYPDEEQGVLLTEFNNHELVYVWNSDGVKIYKDGKEFAFISNRKELRFKGSNQVIGKIESSSAEYKAVSLHGKKVANMSYVDKETTSGQRVFTLLKIGQDHLLEPFLTLTLFDLIDGIID